MKRAAALGLILLSVGLAACGEGSESLATSSTSGAVQAEETIASQAPPSTSVVTSAVPSPTSTAPAPTSAPATAHAEVEAHSLWERLEVSGGVGIGDSLYPGLGGSGYDVESYLITMSYDPATRRISGSSVIEAVTTDDLDLFSLDFYGMETHWVRVNGAASEHQQVGEELIVDPPQTLAEGESMTVVVVYEGVPSSRPASALPGHDAGGRWSRDGRTFFAMNQPDGSAAWAPFNDHPLDKALVTLAVQVPSGWTAVSGGRLVRLQEDEQSTVFAWSMEHPVAPYLIPLAIGPFASRSEPDSLGLNITTWYPEDLDPAHLEALSRQDEYVRFFSERFGPYPFETLGAIVVDAGLGLALEHQTLPTYDRSLLFEQVVLHELAHQWFGDSVSVSDWSDIWLNEGFATFAQWIWEEETRGQPHYDQVVAEHYELFSGALFLGGGASPEEAATAATSHFYPPAIPIAADLFNASVYARGALTLVALRDHLGDEAFFALVQTWHRTHRRANASTADFLSLVETTAGPEARTLVESWIYDPLPPAMPERGLYPLDQQTDEGSS